MTSVNRITHELRILQSQTIELTAKRTRIRERIKELQAQLLDAFEESKRVEGIVEHPSKEHEGL